MATAERQSPRGRILKNSAADIVVPLPPVITLPSSEHSQALLALPVARYEAEELLDGENMGYFSDVKGNTLLLATGIAITTPPGHSVELRIDHWVRNHTESLQRISLQTYDFQPQMVVLTTFNSKTTLQRREANANELQQLRLTLQGCTPKGY